MTRPSTYRARAAKDQEEAALVMKAKGGDPEAFAELERRAARFVGPWLARYLRAGAGRVQREDLEAEARAGLWEGIATFDPARGAALVHISFKARFAAKAFLQREAKYRDLIIDAAFDEELGDDEGGDGDTWLTPARHSEGAPADDEHDGAAEDDEGQARATLLAVIERMPPERRAFARAVLLDRERGSREVLAARFAMTLRQFKAASMALYAEVRQLARPGDGTALQRLAWLVPQAPEDDRAQVLAMLQRPGAASAVAYLRSQLFGFTQEVARARLAHVEEGRPAEAATSLAHRLAIPLRDVGVLEARAIRLMAARAREEGVLDVLDEEGDAPAELRRAS